MSKLVEKKINSQTVYKGNFLDVKKDNVVLPNGKKSTREWINHPGAVVIVPILPNGNIALIRQFRYSMGSEFIELPAGKIDKGETSDQCNLSIWKNWNNNYGTRMIYPFPGTVFPIWKHNIIFFYI